MCGIFGLFSKKSVTQSGSKVISQMMYVDSLRGMDSTGMVVVSNSAKKNQILKAAIPGYNFRQLKSVDRVLSKISTYVGVIGHNRAATKGNVNYDNAHPFCHGDISMVHNGTLTSVYYLEKYMEFDTDSEAICYNIDKYGPEKVIPTLIGAFALVWHNTDTDKISMIRNDQRTLYYATIVSPTTKERGLIFASESNMLVWIATRNGFDVEDITLLEPGMLYEFDIRGNHVSLPLETQLELHTYVKSSSYSNNGSGGWGGKYSQETIDILNLGYERSERCLFKANSFTIRNNKNGYGVIAGTDCYSVVDVESYSLTHSQFKLGDWYVGTVSSLRWILIPGGKKEYRALITLANVVKAKAKDISDLSPTEKKNTHNTEGNEKKKEIVIFKQQLVCQGPRGMITVKEFREKTRDGCSICGDPIFYIEKEDVFWSLDSHPICSVECADQWRALAGEIVEFKKSNTV